MAVFHHVRLHLHVFTIVAVLFLPELAPGQSCQLENRAELGGHFLEIDLRGTTGVARLRDGEIRILDLTDPLRPVTLSRLFMPGHPQNIEISGDHAFVASASAGIQIIDISSPADARIVAEISTPGEAMAISLSGNRGHFVISDFGLLIYDLEDPVDPAPLGAIENPQLLPKIEKFSDDRLLLSDGQHLLLYELTPGQRPRLRGSVRTFTDITDFQVRGVWSYLIGANSRQAQIHDWREIDQPELISEWSLDREFRWIEALHRRVVLFGRNGTIQAFSIPSPPIASHQWTRQLADRIRGVSRLGNQAFVFEDTTGGYHFLDLEASLEQLPRGSFPLPSHSHRVSFVNEEIWTIDERLGLTSLEQIGTDSFRVRDYYHPWGMIENFLVEPGRAFLTGTQIGLQVIDTSTEGPPELVSSLSVDQPFQGLARVGEQILLGRAGESFQIFELENSTRPRIVTTLEMSNTIHDVWISGHLAFTTIRDSGLEVLDLTEPGNPITIGTLKQSLQNPGSIDGQGSIVFVTEGSGGIRAIDISDPRNPTILSETMLATQRFSKIRVHDDHIIAMIPRQEILLLDARDPTALRILDSIPQEEIRASDFDFQSDRLLVGTENRGVHLFDLSSCDASPPLFVRGDADGDATTTIGDAIVSLEYQFNSGPRPPCLAALDVNADGRLDLSDPIISLRHQFLGTHEIAPPFPACGLESLPDELALSCEVTPAGCQATP